MSLVTFGKEIVDIGSQKFMKMEGLIVMFLKKIQAFEKMGN